jgi:hypothetical protein
MSWQCVRVWQIGSLVGIQCLLYLRGVLCCGSWMIADDCLRLYLAASGIYWRVLWTKR